MVDGRDAQQEVSQEQEFSSPLAMTKQLPKPRFHPENGPIFWATREYSRNGRSFFLPGAEAPIAKYASNDIRHAAEANPADTMVA